jgi:hypothetical protein
MRSIPDGEGLAAAFSVVKHLHDDPAATAERYETGTAFVPVAIDGSDVIAAVVQPGNVMAGSVSRNVGASSGQFNVTRRPVSGEVIVVDPRSGMNYEFADTARSEVDSSNAASRK